MNNPWDILPSQFLEKVKKVVPEERLQSVLEAFCIDRPTTFRTNTLKTTTEEIKKELDRLGISYDQVEWYPEAFVLKNSSKKDLTNTDLYANGYIYIQSLSSMIPPLVLDPHPEELVCDLTAAPGSKTTQMAGMMNNTGTIVANDKSRVRLYKLEANLNLQGVKNTKITYLPGQIFWRQYVEYFDKTLVDVPCSLEGRISCLNDKTYRDWTPKKVKELVPIQRFLLRAGVSATKPGGSIVYSTCTLSVEENEGVIDWILEKEKGSVVVESISLTVPGSIAGIVQYGDKKYNPEITKTMRLFPSQTMEGFFVAKLRKTKSNVPSLISSE